MPPSRGEAVSGYYPDFKGPSGIKVFHDNLKSQQLSGTIISANVVYAVTHQLARTPKMAWVQASLSKAQAASATALVAGLADQASATTSAKFYVCGNKAGLKYKAYLIV